MGGGHDVAALRDAVLSADGLFLACVLDCLPTNALFLKSLPLLGDKF